MERAFLSDFEVLKGTADLASRNLIEIGRARGGAARRRAGAVARRRPPCPPAARSASGRALARSRGAVGVPDPAQSRQPAAAPGGRDPRGGRPRQGDFAQPRGCDRAGRADLLRRERPLSARPRGPGRRRHPRRGCPARSVRAASTGTSCGPRTASSVSTAATRPGRSTSTFRSSAASRPCRSCGRRLPGSRRRRPNARACSVVE